MSSKSEPWYIHGILYVIIAFLVYLLIHVAIVEPTAVVEAEKYYKTESRLRMDNLRQAEILWQKKFGQYTDNLNDLLNFINTDTTVAKLKTEVDTLTGKTRNPFKDLSAGFFSSDSLLKTPKSHSFYIIKTDTTVSLDSIINRRGRLIKVDTLTLIGSLYSIECPDGYGSIGDVTSQALKNTASWE